MTKFERRNFGRFNTLTDMRYGLREKIGSEKLTLAAQYRKGIGRGNELVLFIHGLGCNKDSFRDVWEREDFRQFSILVPDLAGFGNSSKPQSWSYSIEDHAASLKKLLENSRYKDKKIHIVGHSMGGAVGLLLAEQLQNVASFTSVEGVMVGEDCLFSKNIISNDLRSFEETGFNELIRSQTESSFKSRKLWAAQLNISSPRALYGSSGSLVTWAESDELLNKFLALKTKKVYFYGQETPNVPVLGRITGVLQVAVPGSRHFVMNDNPDAFYSALAEILKQD